MALVGNRSVLLKSPGRNLAGTIACTDRSNWSTMGQMRNADFSPLAGIPSGHLAGSSWKLPQKPGAMSSINFATLALDGSGSGALGFPIVGSAFLLIDFAAAAGQLISSGSGSAAMSINATGNVLALLNAAGTATLGITTTGAATALGYAAGSATYTVTASMTAYARGAMVGSTVDNSVLTIDAIAAGVLAAALTTPIAANVRRVNSVAVNGTGAPGNEWGP